MPTAKQKIKIGAGALIVGGVLYYLMKTDVVAGAASASVLRWEDDIIKKLPRDLRAIKERTSTNITFYTYVPKVLGAIHAISHGNSDFYEVPADAVPRRGLLGLRYDTAYIMGFRGNPEELKDPKKNLEYGLKWLAFCLKNSYYICPVPFVIAPGDTTRCQREASISAPTTGYRILFDAEVWYRFVSGETRVDIPPLAEEELARQRLGTDIVEKIMQLGDKYRELLYVKGSGPTVWA